jgi:hypothetical protein
MIIWIGKPREKEAHGTENADYSEEYDRMRELHSAEGAGVEPARQLRSPRFQRGAVANRLALPHIFMCSK